MEKDANLQHIRQSSTYTTEIATTMAITMKRTMTDLDDNHGQTEHQALSRAAFGSLHTTEDDADLHTCSFFP